MTLLPATLPILLLLCRSSQTAAQHIQAASHFVPITPDGPTIRRNNTTSSNNRRRHSHRETHFHNKLSESKRNIELARIEGMRRRLNNNRRSTQQHRELQLAQSCEELCKQCITIDVYFHLVVQPIGTNSFVVPHPEETMARFRADADADAKQSSTVFENYDFSTVPEIYEKIATNMRVLNERYADTTFRFEWKNDDVNQPSLVRNADAVLLDINENLEPFFGDAFVGDASDNSITKTLNVFLVDLICEEGVDKTDIERIPDVCVFSGAAPLPSWGVTLPRGDDSVMMVYATLPGGG